MNIFSFLKLLLCIYLEGEMPQHTRGGRKMTLGSWAHSCHHVDSGDQTQVVRLGGPCFYPWCHLSDPKYTF